MRFVFAPGAIGMTKCRPSFPRVFSLSDQSGTLKGTSEKPRGVPPIFLAPYFVNQKYVSLSRNAASLDLNKIMIMKNLSDEINQGTLALAMAAATFYCLLKHI